VKSGLPSVQILKSAPELYSFACRWYVSPSSWVTVLLAPPFWFVVQFVMPVGGVLGAEEDATGTGAGGELGAGLEDGNGLGCVLGDELGAGLDGVRGTRVGRTFGDGLADEDGLAEEEGLGTGLGDDAGPDCATQWT
jgi:hypothetical protein